MNAGRRFPSESRSYTEIRTGRRIRQVTSAASINHHPFFFVPAYDDRMQRLIFVSHRTGSPQIFAEERTSGELVQLTDQDDIAEWSVYPSHDGRYVYFTGGTGGWRLIIDTLESEQLVDFGEVTLREQGMVGAAMGTTALSLCDRWWAVKFNAGNNARLAIIDTTLRTWNVILERDTITHMQFCPDDANLLFYAGPFTDRVWLIDRNGGNNRRFYERQPGQWVTHETWIPGTRELAFVDWPHAIRSIQIDTGFERKVASFNAWHAVCDRTGTLMVCDTNFPDIGLQIFSPLKVDGSHSTLCFPEASNMGDHWRRPFPYEHGPISVYAPQHTHPHPSFSPDGKFIVFTSDRTGYAQVYELELPSTISLE